MLTIQEALQAFNAIEGIKARETVPLLQALNRVLAGPILSRLDHPPFDKSAMDGYAVDSSDPVSEWRIVETIAAGRQPREAIRPGYCSKIMTGAMLPPGADAVVMIEQTVQEGDIVRLKNGVVQRGDHICQRGEDARSGDLVAAPGRRVNAQLLGVLAACGYHEVEVFARPRLTVLTTGDEVVMPGCPLQPGQIYNSNGFSLYGQYQALGLEVRFGGGAADSLDGLKDRLRELLTDCDVLVISGGVSMGDFDFVPQAIQEMGGSVHFAKVAIKPGKPTLFATIDGRLVFGLPGNPVSTFIITEILVKPALLRLMNCDDPPRETVGVLTSAVQRRKLERTEYLPVHCDGNRVRPIEYHGSAHLLSLPQANGLIRIDRGQAGLEAGSQVRVRLI